MINNTNHVYKLKLFETWLIQREKLNWIDHSGPLTKLGMQAVTAFLSFFSDPFPFLVEGTALTGSFMLTILSSAQHHSRTEKTVTSSRARSATAAQKQYHWLAPSERSSRRSTDASLWSVPPEGQPANHWTLPLPRHSGAGDGGRRQPLQALFG
jgi:hypothetical protein